MKQYFYGFVLIGIGCTIALGSTSVEAQDRGEVLFGQTCVACHTIGGGRLVGPDLAGISARRDEAWIISFVKSSQGLVASGDADAIAIVEEYGGMIMPDQPLSDDDIRAIITHITGKSPEGAAPAVEVEVVTAEDLAAEQIQYGQDLFVGKIRFENGATACNACHTANTESVMTGGSLAKDLTDAVSRLSRNGVDAMMANAPFPAMKIAFDGRPLTDAERAAIVDFLQANEGMQEDLVAADMGKTLFLYGMLGLAFLLGIFFFLGLRGPKKSINQALYDRQITST